MTNRIDSAARASRRRSRSQHELWQHRCRDLPPSCPRKFHWVGAGAHGTRQIHLDQSHALIIRDIFGLRSTQYQKAQQASTFREVSRLGQAAHWPLVHFKLGPSSIRLSRSPGLGSSRSLRPMVTGRSGQVRYSAEAQDHESHKAAFFTSEVTPLESSYARTFRDDTRFSEPWHLTRRLPVPLAAWVAGRRRLGEVTVRGS